MEVEEHKLLISDVRSALHDLAEDIHDLKADRDRELIALVFITGCLLGYLAHSIL